MTTETRPLRALPWLLPALLCVLLGAWPRLALGSERVAVLVFGAEPAFDDLADQCTEVLLAALARQGQTEIVGKEEFLARLDLKERADTEACLREATCLARAQAVLGVDSLVFGYLGGEADVYRMHLMRVGVDGKVGQQVKQEFTGGADALFSGLAPMLDRLAEVTEAPLRVDASQRGAQVYLDDRPVGTTPLLLPRVKVGLHRLRVEKRGFKTHHQALEVGEGGQQLKVTLVAEAPSAATVAGGTASPSKAAPGWRKPLLLSLGAASLLTLGTGGVLHTMAYLDSERYLEADDPETSLTVRDRGERRWTAAKFTYGVGAALVIGTATAAWLLRDPAPAAAEGTTPPPSVSLAPTPGGALLSLQGIF